MQTLLNEYVARRQSGLDARDVLAVLQGHIQRLPDEQQRELAQHVRQWELHQATHTDYNPRSTVTIPVKASLAALASPEALPDSPTFEESSDSEEERAQIACPACGSLNPEAAKYCYSCGEVLETAQIGKTVTLSDEEVEDAALFGDLSVLQLTIRGYERYPIRIRFQARPLLMGRAARDGDWKPDIDLSAYGAEQHGVSRIHAALERQNQTLTVVDKGSVNHTYVNGERIHPHERRVLRDGDEIRLGRMVLRVVFRRELRPLL